MPSKQIDLLSGVLAPNVRFGCVHVSGAHLLPIYQAYVSGENEELSLALHGELPPPWDGDCIVSIRMYRLPEAQSEFQKEVNSFMEERDPTAHLPDKLLLENPSAMQRVLNLVRPQRVPFEPSTLALRNVSSDWKHEAFARSGRDIVHTYRAQNHAILIRWRATTGAVLDNPLFTHLKENLRIVDDQWDTAFPEATSRGSHSTSDVDGEQLPNESRQAIEQAIQRACRRLDCDPSEDPRKTAEAISDAVEQHRAGKLAISDAGELADDLGALWGDCLCRAAAWQWCRVDDGSQGSVCAVASASRSHAVAPMRVFGGLLASPNTADNSLLLFNMIVDGDLPPAAESSYCWLE